MRPGAFVSDLSETKADGFSQFCPDARTSRAKGSVSLQSRKFALKYGEFCFFKASAFTSIMKVTYDFALEPLAPGQNASAEE
jgi:hypothetical protein